MGHIKLSKGAVKDVPFKLRTSPGGSLTDDKDWTDGLTAAQWPTFTVKTGGGTDVTSSWAKDITSDTISDATHKHPNGATGLWRKTVGTYRFRVQPLTTLTLGDYIATVEYDIPGTTIRFTEEHVLELRDPGDVEFGDPVLESITVADIEASVVTSLTDEEIQALIVRAGDKVFGMLEACGLDPDEFDVLPRLIRDAIIDMTIAFIGRRDGSAGLVYSNLKEGDAAVGLSGRSSRDWDDREGDAIKSVEWYCKRYGKKTRPRVVIARQLPGDGAFTQPGQELEPYGGT